MWVAKSLFLSVDIIVDKVNAKIIFTYHCIFSNPALFRNYFVINLHFQTKLNQNTLHWNGAYLTDLMHSSPDLQFSEMMDKSKSVIYLLHHQIHIPKAFSLFQLSILCSWYNKFTTYGASKSNETNFQYIFLSSRWEKHFLKFNLFKLTLKSLINWRDAD